MLLLRADVDRVAGMPVIALTGRVDLSTVPTLQDVLARTVDASPGAVVAVDLDGVDALDDVGLGVIVGSAGRARRAGGDVVLVCTRASPLERFALTRLDRAVTVVASLSEL